MLRKRARGRSSPARLAACTAAALLGSAPRGAGAQDPLEQWATRADELDSLYVEATIQQYRVPARLDAADPRNWTKEPRVCPTVDFTIWLRRPNFRVNLRERPEPGTSHESVDFSWVDGRLTVFGGINLDKKYQSGSVLDISRKGRLLVEPYLVPVEYHLFDVPLDNVPSALRKRPHTISPDGVVLQPIDPAGGDKWVATLQLGSSPEVAPRRMALSINFPQPSRPVEWDCTTLETQRVAGTEAIRKARVTLLNPDVLPDKRVVYIWEASRLESRPITRADLTIEFPVGTSVTDFTTNVRWKAGMPASTEPLDPKVIKAAREAARAQLEAPEIRARRQGAMIWIVCGAAAAAILVLSAAYRSRRTRHPT